MKTPPLSELLHTLFVPKKKHLQCVRRFMGKKKQKIASYKLPTCPSEDPGFRVDQRSIMHPLHVPTIMPPTAPRKPTSTPTLGTSRARNDSYQRRHHGEEALHQATPGEFISIAETNQYSHLTLPSAKRFVNILTPHPPTLRPTKTHQQRSS